MKSLGIDVGATTIKGGIVSDGKIVRYCKVPTDTENGAEGILRSLYTVIERLIGYADTDSAVGISSTGDIDPVEGKVIYATDVMPEYSGVDIKKLVEDHTGRSAFIANDCVSALIGEMRYGAGKGCRDAVMLTLGTGLGFAACADGKILTGSRFRAGRFGHVLLYKDGRRCPCGRQGCNEAYVSATGLMRTAHKHGLMIADCNELAQYKDTQAFRETIGEFTDDFAAVIWNVAAIFDPEAIVIGGGLVHLRDLWWDELAKKVPDPQVLRAAQLGNGSGIIGATLLEDPEISKNWKEAEYEAV